MATPPPQRGTSDVENVSSESELSTYGLDAIPEGLSLPSLPRTADMVGAVLGYFNGSPTARRQQETEVNVGSRVHNDAQLTIEPQTHDAPAGDLLPDAAPHSIGAHGRREMLLEAENAALRADLAAARREIAQLREIVAAQPTQNPPRSVGMLLQSISAAASELLLSGKLASAADVVTAAGMDVDNETEVTDDDRASMSRSAESPHPIGLAVDDHDNDPDHDELASYGYDQLPETMASIIPDISAVVANLSPNSIAMPTPTQPSHLASDNGDDGDRAAIIDQGAPLPDDHASTAREAGAPASPPTTPDRPVPRNTSRETLSPFGEAVTYGYDSGMPPALRHTFESFVALPETVATSRQGAIKLAGEVADRVSSSAADAATVLSDRAAAASTAAAETAAAMISAGAQLSPFNASGANAETPAVVQQFVQRVANFSSQYGSISYSAASLEDRYRIYPGYGDFTQAYQMRTFGPWWARAPEAPPEVSPFSRTLEGLSDFVELEFATPVLPQSVTIYETYHPGSVVRILAAPYSSNTGNPWIVLWEGPSQHTPDANKARAFSPPLRRCSFATRSIRLEFDHRSLAYYTQIDAVMLEGEPFTAERQPLAPFDLSAIHRSAAITRRLYRRLSSSAASAVGFSSGDQAATTQAADSDGGDLATTSSHLDSLSPTNTSEPFELLADELVLCVFEFLDFVDLLRVSCVSRRFFSLGYRSHLGFTGLDLQRYWMRVTDGFLASILPRCTNLQRLSLSWSGGGQHLLSPAGFIPFIEATGQSLVTLRLACCTFLNDTCVRALVMAAGQLEDIDLQCCANITPAGIDTLASLPRLRRLNLHNSQATTFAIVRIAEACENLEHLDLGQCGNILNWDTTVQLVVSKAPKLRSLNLWRARSLTQVGILHIAAHCPLLESLDIGWCRSVSAHDCIQTLVEHCPKLRKLFLTAIRSTTTACVVAIASHLSDLEQLDVVGSNALTVTGLKVLVARCPALSYLDVSFCRLIEPEHIAELWKLAPGVEIKSSCQSIADG